MLPLANSSVWLSYASLASLAAIGRHCRGW